MPQVGTAFIAFNLKNGPFSAKDNPDAHMLRMAAAHAIDHEGIHEAVFNKQGEIAKGFYSEASPWHGKDIESWPQFDPDKAKAMRKKAKGGDAKLLIIANDSFPYMQQSGELVHAMLKDAGLQRDLRDPSHAGDPGQVQQGRRSISIRRPTAIASIPTAGTRARSCRRRPRPCAATATRTRRSTS